MTKSTRMIVQVVADPAQPTRRILLKPGSDVGDLLGKMGLLREEFIVMARNRVVTEFEPLKDRDRVRLIRVFSGG